MIEYLFEFTILNTTQYTCIYGIWELHQETKISFYNCDFFNPEAFSPYGFNLLTSET